MQGKWNIIKVQRVAGFATGGNLRNQLDDILAMSKRLSIF
jgi:hypothetical protein